MNREVKLSGQVDKLNDRGDFNTLQINNVWYYTKDKTITLGEFITFDYSFGNYSKKWLVRA